MSAEGGSAYGGKPDVLTTRRLSAFGGMAPYFHSIPKIAFTTIFDENTAVFLQLQIFLKNLKHYLFADNGSLTEIKK